MTLYSSSLHLKLFHLLDFSDILPHQIQITTFPIKPQQTKNILDIAITFVYDKTLSLLFLQLNNFDVLFLLDIADDEKFIGFKLQSD